MYSVVRQNQNFFWVVSLLLVAAIWGGGFAITKIALNSGVQPYAMIGLRFLGAFLLMYLFIRVSKIKIEKEEIKIGLLAGILLYIAFVFQTIGAVHTTASKNAFITGANVVIVPFVYWFMTKNKPKVIVYLTSLLCFIGIGVLSLDGAIGINLGDILTLGCAFFFAVHIALLGAKIENYNPLVINCFQMLSAGILGIGGNFIFENGSVLRGNFTFDQQVAMGILIFFNTFICFLIQTFAQKYISPSRIALIISTEMVFGALFSIMLLGDLMTPRIIIGGIMIFTSILIAEMKGNS